MYDFCIHSMLKAMNERDYQGHVNGVRFCKYLPIIINVYLPLLNFNVGERGTSSNGQVLTEAISRTVFGPRRQEIISKRTKKRVTCDSKK